MTATISGMNAAYVGFVVSDKSIPPAVVLGILWSLSIFWLDRFMVMTLEKSSSWSSRIAPVISRVVLAGLIGLSMSRPFELQIFHREIEIARRASINGKIQGLRVEAEKALAAALSDLTTRADAERRMGPQREKQDELDRVLAEMKACDAEVLRLQKEFELETNGRGGSGNSERPIVGITSPRHLQPSSRWPPSNSASNA